MSLPFKIFQSIKLIFSCKCQDESGPPSPQLAQERMLRDVLLKAVEKLRKNQKTQRENHGAEGLEHSEFELRRQNTRAAPSYANSVKETPSNNSDNEIQFRKPLGTARKMNLRQDKNENPLSGNILFYFAPNILSYN